MKILIGYDGSECSDFAIKDLQKAGLPAEAEAVVLSIGEAWNLPQPVTTDRVSAGSPRFVFPTTRLIEQHLAELKEKSRGLAEAGAAKLKEIFPGWRTTAQADCGNAAVELIKKADEWQPDLIVVGSHGRNLIGRVVLGSVSHKVLHEARCALVRIAKKNESGENAAPRVLIAVDGSANALEAVKIVAGRSWSKETEIRLIAVDDPFSHQAAAGYVSWNLEEDKPEDTEETREWFGKVIGAPAEILRLANLEVSHNIRWGDAAAKIVEEAKDWRADTVFVGARGLGLVKRFLLGSVSSTIAAKAKCSVEVVRTRLDE